MPSFSSLHVLFLPFTAKKRLPCVCFFFLVFFFKKKKKLFSFFSLFLLLILSSYPFAILGRRRGLRGFPCGPSWRVVF